MFDDGACGALGLALPDPPDRLVVLDWVEVDWTDGASGLFPWVPADQQDGEDREILFHTRLEIYHQ